MAKEIYLTGIEAFQLLIAAKRQFQIDHCGQTGVIYMSTCFVRDLVKCGEDALSDFPALSALPGKFLLEGDHVLERDGFNGWPVVIEPGDGGFRIEPVPLENP